MGEQSGFIAGELCLDFANSLSGLFVAGSKSETEVYRGLVAWCQRAGCLPSGTFAGLRRESASRPRDTRTTLKRARRLGEALRGVFGAVAQGKDPPSGDLDDLNREIAQALAMARIIPGSRGMTWGWVEGSKRLDQVLWPIARSAAWLIASERAARVRMCASETCRWLFIDTSKNRRRRWCDMKVCGNRTKVRRYRASKRGSSV